MSRLQDKNKKLLVLDDVWGVIDNLSEIGIPPVPGLKNCKILLTRRIAACRVMGCQRTIQLDILTEGEAWSLFKDAASFDDASLTDEAKLVARACGGLPIAIVSVGKALRGETEIDVWRAAHHKLRQGENEDIPDISKKENAYRSLKFSFDKLPNEETKKCLLMCALLYSEDSAIFVPQLASYAMQLGFCQHSSPTPAQQEDLVEKISEGVRELRNSHLLQELKLETGGSTMHDLVRDVILRIGRRYSAVGEPRTTEFKQERLELQTDVEAHFRNNGFANSLNKSRTANVPIAEQIVIHLSNEGRRCLLLCSFLGTKENEICIEELVRYAYALGVYRPAQSVKDTMALILKAIDELKDYNFVSPVLRARQQPRSTLFLGGRKSGTAPSSVDVQYIKLHATARDIALSIFY